MRVLRSAWPLAPALTALLLLVRPELLHPLAVPFLIAAVAVGLSTGVALAYTTSRIGPLVEAAENIASGATNVVVPSRSDDLGRRLSAAVSAMSTRLASVDAQATTDLLTGLPNRATIAGALFSEVERAIRHRRPLSVIFADIDHFKVVNDSYGHEQGDIVLQHVAHALKSRLRATDLVGRYGGEEFLIVLPETTVADAAALADQLRLAVAGERHTLGGHEQVSVTASFGVTGGLADRLRMDSLLREADAAMYSAKALGRDQVYAFIEPDDESSVIQSPISPAGRTRALELGRFAHGAAAEALASIISPLPHYRGQPSALIATIVSALARSLDLPEHEVDKMRVAALLHDVGKVGIPQDILEKPSSLTAAEWRSVVQHPRIGQVILEQATTLRDAVPIILHHHERFAGEGYPYGLRGQEIPLGARIVAIADAYDAMIQDRPYKKKISHPAAIKELRAHAGTQFDPDLVDLFCDLYADHAPEADPSAVGFQAAFAAPRHAVAHTPFEPDQAAATG
ncbi:MAG: diguanylate cyclase [Chloroflexota bacterium]